jgi:Domain of unknown function (DUF5658)
MFRSLPSLAVASLLALFVAVTPVAAQNLVAANTLSTTVLFPASLLPSISPALSAAAATEASAAAEAAPASISLRPRVVPESTNRPLVLPALYVMQGALQAMDAHSTFSAISRGAHEANPLMQGVVGNKGAMFAVKAGVAASTIWMAESMWKHGNRLGAIVTMIAANSVTAVVVAHNYQLAARLQ